MQEAMRQITYGDGRVSGVCRAAALAFLWEKGKDGRLEQLGKDTYLSNGKHLFRIKSSNTSHLGKNQFFWGAISRQHARKFLRAANKRKSESPQYIFVAPRSR